MTLRFVTHARTLEELRAEFLSSIQRELTALDAELRAEKRASAAARLARAIQVLEFLATFWQKVEIKPSRKGKGEGK